MSVSRTPNTSNPITGAPRRTPAGVDTRATTAPAAVDTESRRDAALARRGASTEASRGARTLRGAKAAPPADATAGGQSVMSVPPSMSSSSVSGGGPLSPYEASARSYEAASSTPSSSVPPVAAAAVGSAAGAVAGSAAAATAGAAAADHVGGWTPAWAAHFRELGLSAADVDYLASSGMGYDDLVAVSEMVQEHPGGGPRHPDTAPSTTPGTAPQPGVDAADVASANPTAAEVTPAGQPGLGGTAGTAFTPAWEQRFTELMRRMGVPASQISSQVAEVRSQPTTEDQLQQTYAQMEAALGDFGPSWHAQFTSVLRRLETPAAERDQVLQQLASSGLTTAQLEQAYEQMESGLPGWDRGIEARFRELDIPKEMLEQLKSSDAPKAALEQQYDQLRTMRSKYEADGRVARLQKAKATPEEIWKPIVEGTTGKEFDKYVDQVHSRHVSGWKRAGSIALNMIPGVYTVQYLTGKDWVTGEKIDRSNPLNIVGAVASGFAGVAAARSGASIIRGLSAANSAAAATMAAGKAGTLAQSVAKLGTSSPLGGGALQAITGAGLVDKFQAGLRMTDYLKAATPLVNRFGEAGRLSAVGRGYGQGMKLAAGAAALRAGDGGRMVVDPAVRSTVLANLREGRGIEAALQAAGRTGGSGGHVVHAAEVAANYNRFGFLQGTVGGGVDGAKVVRGSGTFTFNPFRSRATVTAGSGELQNVISLGRSVDFGTRGGLAQGMGAMRAANGIGRSGTANALVQNAPLATRLSGVGAADDAQRLRAMDQTATWSQRLGVGGASLRASDRAAARVAGMVERGGSSAYANARRAGDLASQFTGRMVVAPLVAGATVGMTGPQMQGGWEYLKDREAIQRSERQARDAAAAEQQQYADMYEQQQAAAAAAGAGTDPVAAGSAAAASNPATTPAATSPQVVGTSPTTGGQLVFDPSIGVVYDTVSGDAFDPATGAIVGNLAQSQAPSGAAPAESAPQMGGAR